MLVCVSSFDWVLNGKSPDKDSTIPLLDRINRMDRMNRINRINRMNRMDRMNRMNRIIEMEMMG